MALAGGAFETVWWSARSCLSTCEKRGIFFCIASGWIHSKVWFPQQSVKAPIRLYRSYGEWFEAGLQADLAFVWLFLKNGFGIFLFVSFSELSQVTSCFCRLLCPTSLLRRLRPELMNAEECSKFTTTSWCGPYIAVVLRARMQLLTYAHCWGLASGLTGRVLQKCTQQLTRRTSAQLDGKDNQSDPTQISLFERGRQQGIPVTETNCHRYKLDDRTVTRVKSPAQSFLKSSPSSPNKNTCLSCEALHPTSGSFIAWPQSVSSRSPTWEQRKPRMRDRSRVQHVLAACSTCFVGFCFPKFCWMLGILSLLC